MRNKLHTGEKLRKFKAMKLTISRRIAKNSVNFFKDDVFNAQGFIDRGVKRWPKKKNGSGRTLVKTGRGRHSIREASVNENGATIKAYAPYMKFHNEGTKTLPQRKFMGNSHRLDNENKRIITQELRRL